MKNKLGYLGLLSILGFVGFRGNHYFFGFFGFAVYFRYFKIIPDELFKDNIRKAATPSFFISIIINALFIGYFTLVKDFSVQNIFVGLALLFALPIWVFTAILITLEISEDSGVEE